METASQTERDGKEQSGNNATVVHGNFPLLSRDNFIADWLVPTLDAGRSEHSFEGSGFVHFEAGTVSTRFGKVRSVPE
jgi:hypothetical protein